MILLLQPLEALGLFYHTQLKIVFLQYQLVKGGGGAMCVVSA
jgi:hypothetical protein